MGKKQNEGSLLFLFVVNKKERTRSSGWKYNRAINEYIERLVFISTFSIAHGLERQQRKTKGRGREAPAEETTRESTRDWFVLGHPPYDVNT